MTDQYVKALIGCIPAYEPAPCGCAQKREYEGNSFYSADCECNNSGDLTEAVRWCERMSIADQFQAVIDAHELEQSPGKAV